MKNIFIKIVLIHIILFGISYSVRSQNILIESPRSFTIKNCNTPWKTSCYCQPDSQENEEQLINNSKIIYSEKDIPNRPDFKLDELFKDPWIWLVMVCILIAALIMHENKYATKKVSLWFYIFAPILLFYISRKSFYWEGNVSIPPYIELTILLLTAILSFIAFYVQYQFNEKQKKDIDDERVENNFFRMYEEHLRLCDSIVTKNIGYNKRAFHFIFYEVQTLSILLNYYFEFFINDDDIRRKLKQRSLFISFSFILSGVTRKSNYNLIEKLSILFYDDESITNFLGLNSKKDKTSLMKIFDFVECLQVIKDEDLEVLKCQNDLILFNDYADVQLKQKLYTPWFCGHRPDLVRYFKSLGNMLNFIRNSKQICDYEKLYQLYDFMFSHMSEHEIGLVFIFTNSYHEYMQILGILSDDSFKCKNTNGKKLLKTILEDYKQKMKDKKYPELKRAALIYEGKDICDNVYSYVWDEEEQYKIGKSIFNRNNNKFSIIPHEEPKYVDEILSGVAMNWILRTNNIYNFIKKNEVKCDNAKIIDIVKKIGNTTFEEYVNAKPCIKFNLYT